MATLQVRDGRSLTLTPVGYEFSEWSNYYDANWLKIELRAHEPGRSWSATDPALLTDELARLCNWLENVAASSDDESVFEGVEPCIAFCREGIERLGIQFRLEFDPDHRFDDGVRWTINVADTNLAEFAADLRREASAFPHRPEASAGATPA
jgi:hypothetical protein